MTNYFQAIQTALFYNKKAFKIFNPYSSKFLDLQGSCDQSKIKAQKKQIFEMWSQILGRVTSVGIKI